MAITSRDQIIAGMQPPLRILKVGATMEAAGMMNSFFYTAGQPAAAAVPSPGINGQSLTSYNGQIPFTNPASGNTNLVRFTGNAGVAGTALLHDRLWHNSGISVTTTTAQNITQPTLPPRDNKGTTDGVGVMAAIEVSTATTNAGAITNTTISYTNSSGVSGRTGTIASFPVTAVAGTFVEFRLNQGDVGIRSIQSITLGTSYGGGAIHLVLFRYLTSGHTVSPYVGFDLGPAQCGFTQLYDNSVPFIVWLPSATTAITFSGAVVLSQG